MGSPFVRSIILLATLTLVCSPIRAQFFTRVADAQNPITIDPTSNSYQGASWIDYNNDGLLDLYVNTSFLYRNLGGGKFVRDTLVGGLAGIGNSWTDYDNDGWLDLMVSGGNSVLYHNAGYGKLIRIAGGALADSAANRGWACAWADYDKDGLTDLIITHPAGFVGTPTTNHLFHNNGDGTFTAVTTTPVTSGLAPYTVATWSDFDNDGDMDLFVGSGPANGTVAPDYLYLNLLVDSGAAKFPRITTGVLATDARDGQVFNWIDYDNDGDLDVYVTNYGGTTNGMPNQLYRNNGGTFVRMTSADVGPIVTHNEKSLASVWEDFDNDGYLDCYVTNDGPVTDRLYINNHNGTFSEVSGDPSVIDAGPHRGATAGDYDNDGKIDLFVNGPGTRRLFHNENANGNHWIFLKCIGTSSNKTATGAKVRVLATIGGQHVWQLREVSSQNSFDGQNDFKLHFGLGDATEVESVLVRWPNGTNETYTGLNGDFTYTLIEGHGVTTGLIPATPALLSPAKHAGGQKGTSTLRWNLAPGASGYAIQIGRDSLFAHPLLDTNLVDTVLQYQVGGDTGAFYWRVRPHYGTILEGGWSAVFDFTAVPWTVVQTHDRWNIISLPADLNDKSLAGVFPNASSGAYAYHPGGGYLAAESLSIGNGYWLKFAEDSTIVIIGPRIERDTVDLSAGWNLVGALSYALPVANVVTEPAAILQSDFYGYQAGYKSAATLIPGAGYWVKSSQEGKLLLIRP